MKGLLFLGLVGAAIYMALVVSHDLLSGEGAEESLTRQAFSNPTTRQLRSWGNDLPALASRAPVVGVIPTIGEYGDGRSEGSGNFAYTDEVPAPPSQSINTAYEPTEWVRVRLAARVHREASVSSPTMRFYQPGTALEVVSRENGWVQISDPISREGGWVLQQYLVPTDGPTVTQTAMATTPNKTFSPTQAKPMPIAKKRTRASRPTVRDEVATAQFETRSLRRAERRRGFGLLFLGRFARAD
jgi:hypothetical protein